MKLRGEWQCTSRAYFEYLRAEPLPDFIVRLGRLIFFRPIARMFTGKVLDIGCGVGHFFSAYRQAYGMDINGYCVRYCLEQGFTCVQGNVYQIPFIGEFFDGVLLSHVLEHLDEPESALLEVRRVLKPGGILIIRVPTASGFKMDKSHKIFFDYPKLVQVLNRHGFEVVDARYYPIPWRRLGELILFNELRVLATKKVR